MPETREHCFYEKDKCTIYLPIDEVKVSGGIEGKLGQIELHPMPPPAGESFHPYSELKNVLSIYLNSDVILKEIEKTKKFPIPVATGK